MDEKPIRDLSPEALARLLAIGSDDSQEDDGAIAEQLRDRLAGTLPLDPDVVDCLPVILGRLSRELLPLRGQPLGKALVDQSVDLDIVRGIKAYTKKLAGRARSEPEHATAITIYFAAIAGALVFHDEKISALSYEKLDRSFATLIDKPWMAPQLVQLFAKARKVCRVQLQRDHEL